MELQWPPNYIEIFKFRQLQIRRMSKNPFLISGAIEYYKNNPIAFINHWVNTYDPRNIGTKFPTHLPLILFPKQEELVTFLVQLTDEKENGLIEKARDMGATWVCCAFSVWMWLFKDGSSVGWGSRKEILVDKIGDTDSIFEKIRMIIRGLPSFFLPNGFKAREHMGFMKIINPENDSTITGEGGDNIGRGGRKSIYFKDESAHYERPEKIEAALGDNTNVQVDISSVNGLGNVFYRKRESGHEWSDKVVPGRINVFIMDWSDHPGKDITWYNKRKKLMEDQGLAHLFAQEVDRKYEAAVEGIIIPHEWFKSAIDAHIHLGFTDDGGYVAALDVADGGRDTNALSIRKGIILQSLDQWNVKDTGVTARKAASACTDIGEPIDLNYDCIGVGSGIKAEANRLSDDEALSDKVIFVPWAATSAPIGADEHIIEDDEETPLIGDIFTNIKAQGWWELRMRFEKTHKSITEDLYYPEDELISIPSDLPLLRTLEKEISQPTMGKGSKLKMLVDKNPPGTSSPNLADSLMMCYWPVDSGIIEQTYGFAGTRTFTND